MHTTCTSDPCTHPLLCTAGKVRGRGSCQRALSLGALGLNTPFLHPSCRSSGVGRTGAFALLYAAVQEVEAGNRLPELAQLVRRMRQQRKHMLQEKVRVRVLGWAPAPW